METVIQLAGVLQRAYTEAQGLVEVASSAILDLLGSNQFMPCPRAMSFFFFKGCALPSSLLFQLDIQGGYWNTTSSPS